MKPYFVCLLLFIPIFSYCQDDELDHVTINQSRIKRPVLKMGIGHIINCSEALLPIGVEYRLNKVVAVEGEVGVPLFFNTLAYTSTTGPQKKLHSDIKYRADVRFYAVSETDNTLYIGLDGSLRLQRYTITDGFFFDHNGVQKSFSSADVHKKVYTANFIIGTQSNISRKLFVEIQAGFGFKGVTLKRSFASPPGGGGEPFKFRWEIPIGRAEDKILDESGFINIPFALRVCYTL